MKKLTTQVIFNVVILIVCFSFAPLSHATEKSAPMPRCGQTDFGLCGFIDAKIWKEERREVFVIEPIYEVAHRFSEGLAAFRLRGIYGYIDISGQVVIEPQFINAGSFDQGLAVAGSNEKLGVINRSGHYVIPPKFSQAVIFTQDVILATSVEKPGHVSIPNPLSTPYIFSPIHNAGLYHIQKGWVTKEIYSFERFDKTERNLIWAQIQIGMPGTLDDIYGLMRADGSWLIKPKYHYAGSLKNDRAPVRKRRSFKTLSGAINGQGEEVIPFKFDYLTHWEDGFLKAGQGKYPNRKFGIVNQKGELLAGRYFDKIKSKNNLFGPDDPDTNYFSVKDGNEWKTLLRDGTLLTDQRIGHVFLACDQWQILYDAKGYVLKPNDPMLPIIHFDSPQFSSSDQTCNPPPTLIRNNAFADILENGSVFSGFFENSGGFFGNHRWVSVDGKWGLADANGGYAISPIYDSIVTEKGYIKQNLPSGQSDTTYKVMIGKETYRLRFVAGKYKQEPYTQILEDKAKALHCKGGYKLKSMNGLWGMVDKNGDDFITPQYRAISCYNSGVAWVPDDVKRQWCPIDKFGQRQFAPTCMPRYFFEITSHSVPEKFDVDPYESNVLWARAWLDYAEGRRESKPKRVPDGSDW